MISMAFSWFKVEDIGCFVSYISDEWFKKNDFLSLFYFPLD